MEKVKIKTETLPHRCEICHQTDQFDAVNNFCHRCTNLNNSLPINNSAINSAINSDRFVNKDQDIFKKINANLERHSANSKDDLNISDYIIWWTIKLGILTSIATVISIGLTNFGTLFFRRSSLFSKTHLMGIVTFLLLGVFVISGRFVFSSTVIDNVTNGIFNFINRLLHKKEE